MARARSQYICQQCGYAQVGWAGKCPDCDSWGSLVETPVEGGFSAKLGKRHVRGKVIKPTSLASISSKEVSRISTKISELDRALGGGIVPGQVILLAGEPGIGKSTILLQVAHKLGNTLYISGEESTRQVKIRADRLKINMKNTFFLEETDIDLVIASAEEFLKENKIDLMVIDSIQTMQTTDLSGMAGSVGQIRECANRMVRFAKSRHIPMFLVGHVTKQGTVAGPAVLAHIVDTVLSFEGDRSLTTRILRTNKNRFGPTDEVGIFTMEDKGLVPIDDTASMFLSQSSPKVPGSVVVPLMEGTRTILAEVQSLVIPTKMAFPKRTAQGIDSKRLEVILAVLTRRCGLPMGNFDVFVNVVGGISVKEPAADLGVALSIASAYHDRALPKNLLAIGEVGLLGEIRQAVAEEKRIKEARRLGFKNIVNYKSARYLAKALKANIK